MKVFLLGDGIPLDKVMDANSVCRFQGCSETVVKWLEEYMTVLTEPLWVFIGATEDVITASQYLDLAT